MSVPEEVDVARVLPVLKEAISSGMTNLTAIVNTHQYVPLGPIPILL